MLSYQNSQQKQKQYYNRVPSHVHNFKIGDQVLALLPTTMNRLMLRWTGPYKVTRRVSLVDYEIEMLRT